jgi:plasmid stabilization system protein ParE
MKHEVRFTNEAEACVRDIRDWLSQRSPSGALRWIDALESACHRIAERPTSFALAPEADEFSEPLRQALFKTRRGRNYRALFVVRESVVHVVSVRGAGQAPIDPAHIDMPD